MAIALLIACIVLGFNVAYLIHQRARTEKAEVLTDVIDSESLNMMNDAVRKVTEVFDRARDIETAEAELRRLNDQLHNLETKKTEIIKGFERRELETEHKIGLLRSQHEHEVKVATETALLEVREQNLQKDQQRFEDQMTFERKQVKGEMESLRKLTSDLLERLPDARILANLGNNQPNTVTEHRINTDR